MCPLWETLNLKHPWVIQSEIFNDVGRGIDLKLGKDWDS
jgi:hypothetical protein